jgi:uncharacterized protein (TIGR02453 family)
MRKTAYFGRQLFEFFRDLKAHNDREWFLANRERYEAQVRDPFLRLLVDLMPGMAKINPKIIIDPRPTRGSMLRINRDIRFSKDKSPYKTAVAAHFWYAKGREGAMPGYYLHISPEHSMLGTGIWQPDPQGLRQIREAIVANPKRWQKASSGLNAGSGCSMVGESLRCAPRICSLSCSNGIKLRRRSYSFWRRPSV